MKMIDPSTRWFKLLKVPCFELDGVARGNSEYTDKSYARVNQLFNQTRLFRYPCPNEVVFYNGSKLK